MAEVCGKSGSVSYTNFTAGASSWSLEWSADITDITDFDDGSTGYHTKLACLKNWTATVEHNFDSANTIEPGDSATLTLTVTSGVTYSGTALVESMSVNTPIDDVVTGTVTFTGNGELTYASS